MLFKPYLLFTTQDGTDMFADSHTVKAVGDSTNCKNTHLQLILMVREAKLKHMA